MKIYYKIIVALTVVIAIIGLFSGNIVRTEFEAYDIEKSYVIIGNARTILLIIFGIMCLVFALFFDKLKGIPAFVSALGFQIVSGGISTQMIFNQSVGHISGGIMTLKIFGAILLVVAAIGIVLKEKIFYGKNR